MLDRVVDTVLRSRSVDRAGPQYGGTQTFVRNELVDDLLARPLGFVVDVERRSELARVLFDGGLFVPVVAIDARRREVDEALYPC